MPYDIPNVRCENGAVANHVRIGWYRSVYNIPHAFAVCSFADELAAAAGKDPVEYLRELLGPPRTLNLKALGVVVDYPNYGVDQLAPGIADQYLIDTARLRGVLDLAAANSNWGQKLPPRQGEGVRAPSRSLRTLCDLCVKAFLLFIECQLQVALRESRMRRCRSGNDARGFR